MMIYQHNDNQVKNNQNILYPNYLSNISDLLTNLRKTIKREVNSYWT